MKNYIESLEKLVNEFSKLPGVGKKTARRYAYYIINADAEEVKSLSESILQAKQEIHYCQKCGNFTDKQLCDVCCNANAEPVICVVKEPKDVTALEKVKEFKGTYHVLHGVISPLQGITPNDLNIKSLLTRLNSEHIKEVIIATNPDVEGEATAIYLANLIKPLNIKVTRLAQGISMGSELEFADEITLSHALINRQPMG